MPKITAAAKRSKRLASVANLAFIEKSKEINPPEKSFPEKPHPKNQRQTASPIERLASPEHECLPGPSDESRRKHLQAEANRKESRKRQLKTPVVDTRDSEGPGVDDNQQPEPEKVEQPSASSELCTKRCTGDLSSSDDEAENTDDPEAEASEKSECSKVQRQEKRIRKLQKDKNRLTALNFSLQEALMKKQDGTRFLDVEGFPNSEWLMKASITANDSDYIFVKELMVKLWPNGCGNATVTGRKSNNPSGLNRNRSDDIDSPEATIEPAVAVTKLDAVRVDYIRDRLFERRLILQDQCHTAQLMAKQVSKHIARALSNNPKLRTTNIYKCN